MKKIFCFGDGFATGHIWPEWPQILKALVPDYQVINTAGIGAGPEFLVSGFVDLLPDLRDSTVIFQWPDHRRFDKLVQDQTWDDTINNDPVYHFNICKDVKNRSWWLSSASTAAEVKQYHSQFVQSQQAQHRLHMFKELVSHTAENLNCCMIHASTAQQHYFSQTQRFKETRQKEIQPSPIVHFYWLVEYVLPQTDINVDAQVLSKLEVLITDTQWVPYHPDRDEIWKNIESQVLSN